MEKWKALDAFFYWVLVKSNVFDMCLMKISKVLCLMSSFGLAWTTEKAVSKIFDLTGSCEDSSTQTNFCLALFSRANFYYCWCLGFL